MKTNKYEYSLIMPAQEAFDRSASNETGYINGIKQLKAGIEEQTKKGNYELRLIMELPEEITRMLTDKGYEVKWYGETQMTVILWSRPNIDLTEMSDKEKYAYDLAKAYENVKND